MLKAKLPFLSTWVPSITKTILSFTNTVDYMFFISSCLNSSSVLFVCLTDHRLWLQLGLKLGLVILFRSMFDYICIKYLNISATKISNALEKKVGKICYLWQRQGCSIFFQLILVAQRLYGQHTCPLMWPYLPTLCLLHHWPWLGSTHRTAGAVAEWVHCLRTRMAEKVRTHFWLPAVPTAARTAKQTKNRKTELQKATDKISCRTQEVKQEWTLEWLFNKLKSNMKVFTKPEPLSLK